MNKDIYKKKIAVIGAGWYGCHLALSLKKAGYDVVLYEKNHEIFSQISGKFGIRLHAGPHYPRSAKTRESCRRGAAAFKTSYPDLVIPHEYSIYGLGITDADDKPSRTNQKDFERICKESDPEHYKKINLEAYGYEGLHSAYSVDESSIAVGNRLRSKFKEYLHAAGIEVRCDFEVTKLDPKDSKIIVGNDSSNEAFDKVINTTSYQAFNKKDKDQQFPFDMEAIYQPCLALIYKDNTPGKHPFSFIVMDGWFPCLMPFIENEESTPTSRKYILTHGKWTIMGSYDAPTKAKNVLSNIDNSFIEEAIKPLSEKEMLRFWPKFKERFTYVGWQGEVIAKLKTKREFRSAVTYEKDMIIHVIPGKVSNIFDVENEMFALLYKKNILQREGYLYAAKGSLDESFSEIIEKPAIGEPNTSNLQTYDELKPKSTFTGIYSFLLQCIANLLEWSLIHAAILVNSMKELSASITKAITVVRNRYNMFSCNIEFSVKIIEEPPVDTLSI